MKYYQYWVNRQFNIRIGAQKESINILSGSNVSEQDAFEQAIKRCEQVERRIQTKEPLSEYDIPIKEQVDTIIDSANIVTICRYGAKIINTEQYTILDLDDYPLNFFDWFNGMRKLSRKERIVAKFLQQIKKYPELGEDFRIYETTKGVRVIGKKYLAPEGKHYQHIMRKLNVDWLYITLSQKQQCYRARITPKPYRMRFRTIKIKSPVDCQTESYQQWAKEYAKASERYAVVKFVKSIGLDFSTEPVIKFHDEACKAFEKSRLA
ncbi:hypothetical protein [Aliikangiella maris]|uniref:WYL domain-containing protein n=2 Tax=Aliikangiella maris TaxID=3162458 RepID=A0ABV2BZ39_9GAMM